MLWNTESFAATEYFLLFKRIWHLRTSKKVTVICWSVGFLSTHRSIYSGWWRGPHTLWHWWRYRMAWTSGRVQRHQTPGAGGRWTDYNRLGRSLLLKTQQTKHTPLTCCHQTGHSVAVITSTHNGAKHAQLWPTFSTQVGHRSVRSSYMDEPTSPLIIQEFNHSI